MLFNPGTFLIRRSRSAVLSIAALVGVGIAIPVHSADQTAPNTATPIKHVVVVIGENRSFDHLYGTYVPKSGDTILNLLSEGIVHQDGSPGRHFAAARQSTTSPQTSYFIGVTKKDKTPYTILPDPTLGGAPNVASTTSPPFKGLTNAQLAAIEPSLAVCSRSIPRDSSSHSAPFTRSPAVQRLNISTSSGAPPPAEP